MKRLDDLTYGAECALRGLRIFYTRPRLWPYAVPPILCVLLLYAAVLYAVFGWGAPWLREWVQGITFPGWLAWLQTVLNWCLSFFLWIAVPLLLLVCLGSLYEMFGNMLFDLLVDAFEKGAYPEHPGANQTYGRTLRLTVGFVILTIVSNLKKIPLLLLFLIPYAGAALYYLYCSGVCGRSYLHDSAIRQGFEVGILKKQVAKNRSAVLGFGIVAFLMEAVPILIPGLVIGGSILYHTRLLDHPAKSGKLPAGQ